MTIDQFNKDILEAGRLAKRATYANAQLTESEAVKAFDRLEEYCNQLVGTWGMSSEQIQSLAIWASETFVNAM